MDYFLILIYNMEETNDNQIQENDINSIVEEVLQENDSGVEKPKRGRGRPRKPVEEQKPKVRKPYNYVKTAAREEQIKNLQEARRRHAEEVKRQKENELADLALKNLVVNKDAKTIKKLKKTITKYELDNDVESDCESVYVSRKKNKARARKYVESDDENQYEPELPKKATLKKQPIRSNMPTIVPKNKNSKNGEIIFV